MHRDTLSWLGFLAVISSILILMNGYIGVRLTALYPPGSIARPIIWTTVTILAAMVIASPILKNVLVNVSESFSRIFLFIGYSYLGFVTLMFFVLLCFDLTYFISSKTLPATFLDQSRRNFLFGYGPWAALGATVLLSAKGFQTAVRGPDVVEVDIAKKDLHRSLKNFKIAQISDLHVSSTIKKDYVEDVVQKTMALKPDMIVLTGDLVDGSFASLKDDVEPLRKLKAQHGVYYITGNHEYYWGATDWEKVFKDFGFVVLHNAHRLLEVGEGGKIMVAGVPDFTVKSFGLGEVSAEEAFRNAGNRDFTLFLVHQPGGYKLIENQNCDLQLSGHTHAGQFFPASLFIKFFHRYAKGLYRHENKFWVYVNPGTGYWGPPNRLGVSAEITLLKLV